MEAQHRQPEAMERHRAAEVAHFDGGAGKGGTWSHQRPNRATSALRQAEQALLVAPQMLFAGEEELIELRRLDLGAAQHGVSLAAVMDLMLEEMFQDRGHARRRRGAVGPWQDQRLAQPCVAL